VFVRDVVQLWRIVAMAWMFVTPVFWDMRLMARNLPPSLVPWLENGNPFFALLQAHRLVLGGSPQVLGDFWPHLGIASAWAVGAFAVGYTTFVSRKHKFADLI
jgi:ABC-type polysaccharide/polyol phosphate export permease